MLPWQPLIILSTTEDIMGSSGWGVVGEVQWVGSTGGVMRVVCRPRLAHTWIYYLIKLIILPTCGCRSPVEVINVMVNNKRENEA